MQISLKENIKIKKTLTVLSLIASLLSLFVVFISDFILPIPAALLAIICLIERGGKRWCMLTVSAVALISNVVSVFLFDGFVLGGFEIVLFASVITYCFSSNVPKAETAFALTGVAAVFVVLNAILFAMSYSGVYNFDAVSSFYTELYELVKDEILTSFASMNSALSEAGETAIVSSEQIVAILDSAVSLLISFIAIGAFIVAGVTLKFFSFLAYRLTGNVEIIYKWRFKPSSLFAYFYLLLFVLAIFVSSASSLFGICVANLSNIFCVVFAYVGFNFALALLSMKRSVAFSFILLIIGLVLFSTLMIEVLSVVGAFTVITGNKSADKSRS